MSRIYDNWIDAFIQYTDDTEPPLTYRTWTAISVIAAALQRKVFFSFEGLLYPNMFIVLVSPGGRARKGTAMRYGREFLNKLGITIAAEAPTREALIRRIRLSKEQTMDGENADFHSSLTIYSDELSVFLGSNDKLIPDMCNWFDCPDPWVYETKDTKKTDRIHKMWINLMGGTTPESLMYDLPPEAIGSGLISRIIFIYEQNKGKIVHLPPGINTKLWTGGMSSNARKAELIQMNEDLETDLQYIHAMRGEFLCTERWAEKWIAFKDHAEKNPIFQNTVIKSYNERRQIHLIKLCMIVSAARSDDMIITEDDFNYAYDIILRAERKMPYAFSGVGRADISATLSRVIAQLVGKKEMKYSELMKLFYRDATSDDMKKVLQTLKAMGEIDYTPIMKGNVPTGDYMITYKGDGSNV